MRNYSLRFTSKQEIASAYGISTKTLANWINKNLKLMAALSDTEYNPNAKRFTPRQVKLIVDNLGYPDCYLPDELLK